MYCRQHKDVNRDYCPDHSLLVRFWPRGAFEIVGPVGSGASLKPKRSATLYELSIPECVHNPALVEEIFESIVPTDEPLSWTGIGKLPGGAVMIVVEPP